MSNPKVKKNLSCDVKQQIPNHYLIKKREKARVVIAQLERKEWGIEKVKKMKNWCHIISQLTPPMHDLPW